MEQIHQEGLATAYTAVQVQAPRGRRLRTGTPAKTRDWRLPPRLRHVRFRRLQLPQQRIETSYRL